MNSFVRWQRGPVVEEDDLCILNLISLGLAIVSPELECDRLRGI